MTPQELTLIRLNFSEPMTVDEEKTQAVIYSLAGEIERLWMQLAAAHARIAELEAWSNAYGVVLCELENHLAEHDAHAVIPIALALDVTETLRMYPPLSQVQS